MEMGFIIALEVVSGAHLDVGELGGRVVEDERGTNRA